MIHHTIDRAAEVTRLWFQIGQLTQDAQSVVVMRMMGMGGAWSVPRDETADMIYEKMPAFAEAMLAGGFSALCGRSPDRVLRAMLDPLSDRARDNRERLARRGPAMFGLTTCDREP